MSKKAPNSRKAPAQPKQAKAAGVYINRAQGFLRDGDIQRGINMLLQGIKIAPENITLHLMLGEQLGKHGRAEASIKHYEKALEIDPDSLMGQINLGQAYSKKNRYEDAAPLLQKALDAAPDNPGVHMAYGVMLQRQGELPESVEHFRQALELKLEQPEKNDDKLPAPKKEREDFNKPETEELMWDALHQLAMGNVHAFACYGTLLGIVRDGTLISFDKDLDFGLPHSEMERAVRCLENHGWVEDPDRWMGNPRAMVHPVKKVSVDLFGFVVDAEENMTFTGFWLDDVPHEWNQYSCYPPMKLEKGITPAGDPIWTLQEPEKWLGAIYGDGWKAPDPNFDTVIQAKNFYRFALLTQCYAFSRIYNKWQEGQAKKAMAMVKASRAYLPEDSVLQKLEARLEPLVDAPA